MMTFQDAERLAAEIYGDDAHVMYKVGATFPCHVGRKSDKVRWDGVAESWEGAFEEAAESRRKREMGVV